MQQSVMFGEISSIIEFIPHIHTQTNRHKHTHTQTDKYTHTITWGWVYRLWNRKTKILGIP